MRSSGCGSYSMTELEHRDDQVAMGQHRALGEPGGAAGVEQPRGRVLVDVAAAARRPTPRRRRRRSVGRPSAAVAADHDDVLQRRRSRRGAARSARGTSACTMQHAAPRRCSGSTPTPWGGGGSSGTSAPCRPPERRSSTRRTRAGSRPGCRSGRPARPARASRWPPATTPSRSSPNVISRSSVTMAVRSASCARSSGRCHSAASDPPVDVLRVDDAISS